MSRLSLLITLILLAPAPIMAEALAGAAATPTYRSFKDWVIGCDNTRSCIALGLQPDDSGGRGAFIQVERAAGGLASAAIRLALFNEALTPGEPMTVTIDGGPAAGLMPTRPVEYQGEEGGYAIVTLRETEIASFIDAVRRGRRLRLADASGKGGAVSLDGAMAALLFMDDVQGRIGTVTALVRPGGTPASAVPPPPPLPKVRPLPAPEGAAADPDHARVVRQRLAREQPDACEFEDTDFANVDEVLPLGEDKALVSLLCWRGAYNFTSTYFVVEGSDAENARPVRFPSPIAAVDPDATDESSLTNGYFDPQSGRLGFFGKGRGPGDCGESGDYAWTGKDFALVSYQFMDVCRGVPMPFWPVLWRADVR
jgi:antitoxin (DNA-binding transcriptional repressor) of toxin-antitoxin stability system